MGRQSQSATDFEGRADAAQKEHHAMEQSEGRPIGEQRSCSEQGQSPVSAAFYCAHSTL